MLNHIYQHHGPRHGLRFLNVVQRLTTSVSLYAYSPSVGLDDCLMPQNVTDLGSVVVLRDPGRGSGPSDHCNECERLLPPRPDDDPGPSARETGIRPDLRVPYRLENVSGSDAEVRQLVQLCAASATYVTRFALGQKVSRRAVPDQERDCCGLDPASDYWSSVSTGRLNQIALFAMLATKGSVSNLIQCCHSLGRRLVCTSVGMPTGPADGGGFSIAPCGLQSCVPAR